MIVIYLLVDLRDFSLSCEEIRCYFYTFVNERIATKTFPGGAK